MSTPSWRTVGLAIPGAAHVAQGRDGDDAFAAARIASLAGEAVVLSLADGVGARRFSGGAARLAVHAAAAELRRGAPLPDEPAPLVKRCLEALAVAQRAVDLTGSLATEASPPPACTLLLAVALADLIVCLAVGDGAVVHVTGDGAMLMPIGPDPEAPGSANVVSALVAGEPCPSPQVLTIAEAATKAVALTSDGLANVSVIATPEGPVIAPASALDVLVRHVADGGEARSLRDYVAKDGPLRARTADDLSLVVAAR